MGEQIAPLTPDGVSSNSSNPEYDHERPVDLNEQVNRLAIRLTRQSASFSSEETLENPFTGLSEDSLLNPRGPNFSARAWIKNALAIRSRDPDRYPQRTAGIAFRNLSVHGFGSPTDYQKDVFNSILSIGSLVRRLAGSGKNKLQILDSFDGLVKSGEMLVVLGRPGSGCTTLLRTISGENNGTYVEPESYINYQGISANQMRGQFRGEAIYTAEVDVHFPQLTVGQTLAFAARARAPRNRIPGVSRGRYAEHMKDVALALFGLSHTVNTKVGNDFVRGVSGGERKRVSIAEAALSGSPLQCWDNSTRGLDSANAIEFCETLRTQTDLMGVTACVAIYQAPQSAYDVSSSTPSGTCSRLIVVEIFDKVVVLYEGRQIYFGRTEDAKKYFLDMGFLCPNRKTTPDFLTSLTSDEERIVKTGFENKVPRSPDEFAAAWKKSSTYAQLKKDITAYETQFPIGGESVGQFLTSRRAQQSRGQRAKSPYTLSIGKQIGLCVSRGFDRLRGDMSLALSGLIGNTVMALIIGSVFYNLQPDTNSFYSRGALLFFAVLLNAFSSALEILTLYAQRPIVEKHSRYALYHPFAEAVASMLCDLPYKFTNAILFNVTLYFLTNLRRTPGAFFTFFLFSIVTTLAMSMIFRTIGALSRTLAQAQAPAALLVLGLIIYTGFSIPIRDMLGWSRWMNYVDPISYAFEALMINEFSGRIFTCSRFVPMGPGYDVSGLNKICSTVGAVTGAAVIDGDMYINQSFQYYQSHLWRNLGIVFAFMIFFCATYLLATEYISEAKSKGEVLLFRRGHAPITVIKRPPDEEKGSKGPADLKPVQSTKHEEAGAVMHRQTAVFHWKDVCYDIKIKRKDRRILDHVDGWVKPGTCTALMGVSGAGKTTLLDVLAARVTTGVVSGDMLVDGRQRDSSFQRKTGYVQQQDLHLATTTVREALRFSAVLRQPASTSRNEKMAYVEEVIELLDMELYADAIVGVPGEGLNVEQRKRLTIGVELVAKPQLLLFLDEPTSGLDSQTSWSILNLLETLTKHGQAILCTIHQPSATLFQRFDRLLFLSKGGKTVYFGDIGEKSSTLISYFERNGGPLCPIEANPAEWILKVIGAAPGSSTDVDWRQVWRDSPEIKEVHRHLADLISELSGQDTLATSHTHKDGYEEYGAPFSVQIWECGRRIFSQYWRTPSYIYSKFALSTFTVRNALSSDSLPTNAMQALYIGFSFFKSENSQQGLQNQLFSIFILLTIFGNFVQQIMPNFVTQRALYESRERPAKIYSWQAFMCVNIIVEACWNTLMAVFMFYCWYYPIGLYRNAEPTDAVMERGGLMFLLILSFLLFSSTFAHMIIAGIELAETGGNIANLIFSLMLIFNGVLATPTALPGFWIFMYRVSPFTYLISAMLSTGIANTIATCSDIELLTLQPTPGNSCGEYMQSYISSTGGYLTNANASSDCRFCAVADTNTFLASVSSSYADRWRNLGIMAAFTVFNVFAALGIYWLVRLPKKHKGAKI
ncbi:MAG: hypothetical protein Q9187_000154 [Circinaria calcarea]